MKKILENPYLSLIIRIALGGLFVLWSIGKIADSALFAEEIVNYRMLSAPLVGIMAVTMPWIELVCGLFLIAGVRLKANSAIIGVMVVMFMIAISSAMARGLDIGCGCSTENAVKVGWPKLGFDLGMLLAALYIYFYPVKKFTLERLSSRD